MIKVGNAQLWVHDQEAALAFWTTKVGFEIREDVTVPEMGNFRWLSVGPASQPDFGVVLMAVPGPPIFDAEMQTQVADLTAKGGTGTIFLVTEDCQASYEELAARGVEFVDKPTQQIYGIDASFRDPSGNNIRLTQVQPMS